MGVYFAISWSVAEGTEGEVDEALDAVRSHIEAEHPEIISTMLLRQFVGSEPHRAYLWLEEYASLTAIDQLESTPACDEVWQPIRALMTPGTHHQSIWSDAGKRHWATR